MVHPRSGREVVSLKTIKQDFLASIVVFLVALPLCMGIAIASGVPVAAGLITGIIGGIVVGTIAGSPLQVSGPAAGLTVIIFEIVQRLGLETLGIIVLLAGSISSSGRYASSWSVVSCGLACSYQRDAGWHRRVDLCQSVSCHGR